MEFDKGNFIPKAKAKAPVMMPRFLNLMDWSMEDRRGHGGKRVRLRGRGRVISIFQTLSPKGEGDRMFLALAAIPFGVVMFILGFGNADYLSGSTLSFSIDDVLSYLARRC